MVRYQWRRVGFNLIIGYSSSHDAMTVFGSFLVFFKLCLHLFVDAGCFQIGAHLKANFESQTRSLAAVRVKVIENANEIFGSSMAQVKYENNERHLSKSASSAQR